MALGTLQLLVNTFEMEIAVRMLKPGHAVQAIMAINTGITEICHMDPDKYSIETSMAARAGGIQS
jgi:hypothetical protein